MLARSPGTAAPDVDVPEESALASTAIGELVNTGGLAAFEGYYRNDEANAERTRGGWYWSGDLGYRDEQGFCYFAGRGDDWLRLVRPRLTSAAGEPHEQDQEGQLRQEDSRPDVHAPAGAGSRHGHRRLLGS